MDVLRIIDSTEKSFIKRYFYSIFSGNPTRIGIDFEGNIIRYITYIKRGDTIPWGKIASLTCNYDKRVVIDSGIDIPKDCGIKRIIPESLSEKIFRDSVFSLIKSANISPQKLRLCLYDPSGENKEMVESLVKMSSEIKVVTNDINGYIRYSDKLFEEYGVSILINNQFSYVNHLSVVIAPDRIRQRLYLSPNSLVFTPHCPTVELKARVYFGCRLRVPNEYKVLIPDEIDDNYFISSLYEEYKLEQITKFPVEYFVTSNMYVQREDLLKQIRKVAFM